MKNRYFSLVFALVLILTIFHSSQVSANESPASATGTVFIFQTTITISPISGAGGTHATVTGSYFPHHQSISIIIIDSEGRAHVLDNDVISDANGDFFTDVTIPDKVYPGLTTISATHHDVTLASTPFTVPFPIMAISPTSGTGGTHVTLTGSGFAIHHQVNISIGHSISSSLTLLRTVSTDDNGAFITQVTIPENISARDYFIFAREDVNHSVYAAASFTGLPAPTITIVSSSDNPSVFGQHITFTASVSSAMSYYKNDDKDHDADSLTGTVIFTIDGVAQPPVKLSSDKAIIHSTTLSVGPHTVSAEYSGDNNFASSSSAILTQTVNHASSKVTLTSSENPSKFGSSVNFKALVSLILPASGTPTGGIVFTIDGVTQPTVLLSSGTATLATSSLSAGSHTVTAAYSGDTNDAASTSPVLTQTVNKLTTSTTLSSSSNPSIVGHSVSFTAKVSPNTATGTITFTIDGITQPAVIISSGQATVSSSSLSVGSHTVLAKYSGDTNFGTSSSSSLVQKITK